MMIRQASDIVAVSLRELAALRPGAKAEPHAVPPSDNAAALRPYVHLFDRSTVAQSFVPLGRANGLQYLRADSHPGGVLEVRVGPGGQPFNMRPGQSIRFQDAQDLYVRTGIGSCYPVLSTNSDNLVYARLMILDERSAEFTEPSDYPVLFRPITVLGSLGQLASAVRTFVTLTEDTAPTGTEMFVPQGARRARLFFDGQSGGANATSWSLRFWVAPAVPGTESYTTATTYALEHENSYGMISIPDSSPTGTRYRVVDLSLVEMNPYDQIGLEITDLLPAARTTVGVIVQLIG